MSFLDSIKKCFSNLSKKEKSILVYAPHDGTIVSQSDIKDEVFAEGHLGVGCGIKPDDQVKEICAFMDGEIEVVSETLHSYVIKHKDGVSVLLHLGIDTVKIDPNLKPFTQEVIQGSSITTGNLLTKMDLEVVRDNAPDDITIILVQKDNLNNKTIKHEVTEGQVKKGQLLFTIK